MSETDETQEVPPPEITVAAWECSVCGVLVSDRAVHTRWHAAHGTPPEDSQPVTPVGLGQGGAVDEHAAAPPASSPPDRPARFRSRDGATCEAWQVTRGNLAAVAAWVGGAAHTWGSTVVIPQHGVELQAVPGAWVSLSGHWTVYDTTEAFAAVWEPMP